MHEEINFEPRTGYGLTSLCPHGLNLNGQGVYVGSTVCQKCKHNVSADLDIGKVVCSFIGDHCDEARDSAKDGPNV